MAGCMMLLCIVRGCALLAALPMPPLAKAVIRIPPVCMHERLVPTVFLLGGQKAGSTSLFGTLVAHVIGMRNPTPLPGDPDFFEKEVHFFDIPHRANMGLAHYTKYYGACPNATEPTAAGMDGTPNYLQDFVAPARARKVMGQLTRHVHRKTLESEDLAPDDFFLYLACAQWFGFTFFTACLRIRSHTMQHRSFDTGAARAACVCNRCSRPCRPLCLMGKPCQADRKHGRHSRGAS